jgi:AcrR family transcriptional regulator
VISRDKRRQILGGAKQVFGELGFERASVDAIAARAGVSKATVYHHFEDKQALFLAAIFEEIDALREGLQACLERPAGDVEQALQHLGERVLSVFLSPSAAGLYRQAVAESARLPEVGRLVFERGTGAIQQTVAEHLARWHETGALRVDDPHGSAVAFLALCQGDLATRSRLGILEHPADALVRDSVRRAVRIFLRAHEDRGVEPSGSTPRGERSPER